MSAIEVAIQSPKEAKSRGRPRKSVLSVCEEPSGEGCVDVLLDLRRELDDQGSSKECVDLSANDAGKGVRGTASPEKASDKAEEKARVKAEKAAAKLAAREEAKAAKLAAKLAAKEEAKAAREEAKLEAKAAKLAEREAKKDAKKLEREAAREAKKAEREAAKKVSKKAAVVAKADSEPNVADEVELVVEAYESESEMVCDGAKNEAVPWDAWPVPRALLSRDTGEEVLEKTEVEMMRQPSTGYEVLEKTEKSERDVFDEPSRFYDSWCDP